MIFPIWQPLFSSSHLLAQSISVELGEKTTHTGTLDPLAEGVLIILSGEDRLAKEAFSDWDKEYEFEILWGVATDSGDLMGIIQEIQSSTNALGADDIQRVAQGFLPQYQQQLPEFSARRWGGKSSFDFAREGKPIPRKTRVVQIKQLKILEKSIRNSHDVFALQQEKVSQVAGDFRQQEILQNWQEHFHALQGELVLTKVRVTVSSGFYVRQFIQDLAKGVNLPALAYSIVRTKNGPYDGEDCTLLKCIEDP